MEEDMQPPWPKLPMECCQLIIDCLRRDLPSLAALIRVNKAMFALAAPHLYRDPFALINEQLLRSVDYSDEARWAHQERMKKVFATLLHGILKPVDRQSSAPMPPLKKPAVTTIDPSRPPNRYLRYYTHVDLTLMPGERKSSLFRRLFSPKRDDIGLPMIGVKNMIMYQANYITLLRLPLRFLRTFRPYQQSPMFPDLKLFTALRSLRHLEIIETPSPDLEELSIFLSGELAALGLESLSLVPPTYAVNESTNPTLGIKKLRVLVHGRNSAKHSWLRDAIALCANTLKDLTVIHLPLINYGWHADYAATEDLPPWLVCRLPKLASLTYISENITYPFTFPPFTAPHFSEYGSHSESLPTIASNSGHPLSNTNAIDSTNNANVLDPVADMFPRLTSLSLVRGVPSDRFRLVNLPSGNLGIASNFVGRLSTLKHLLLDFSSDVDYRSINASEVFNILPRNLETFEFGGHNTSEGENKLTEFRNNLRQLFTERRQKEIEEVMNGSAPPSEAVWRPIPKITAVVPLYNSRESLEETFWRHEDFRDYFYRFKN
ncbi:hypothetical protein BGW41_001917 [Actinomortierella wolfii]|nr:hypothetical protein BGW41_001917 [Actinomortierella wolfii]